MAGLVLGVVIGVLAALAALAIKLELTSRDVPDQRAQAERQIDRIFGRARTAMSRGKPADPWGDW